MNMRDVFVKSRNIGANEASVDICADEYNRLKDLVANRESDAYKETDAYKKIENDINSSLQRLDGFLLGLCAGGVITTKERAQLRDELSKIAYGD